MGKFKFLSADDLADSEIYLEIEKALPGAIPLYVMHIVRAEDHTIVGQITLQVADGEMVYFIGHIGYRVNEAFRGNNYALKACRLIIRQARKHNMKELIITCNPDNIPSRRTLERLGGALKEIVPLPVEHELYQKGDREKCIFMFDIEEVLRPCLVSPIR